MNESGRDNVRRRVLVVSDATKRYGFKLNSSITHAHAHTGVYTTRVFSAICFITCLETRIAGNVVQSLLFTYNSKGAGRVPAEVDIF